MFSFVDTDFDIIDEALHCFKANVFFRTYEIKASHTLLEVQYTCLIVLMLFIRHV